MTIQEENHKSSVEKILYSIRLILCAYKSYIGHPLGGAHRDYQSLRISENTFRQILHREMETIAGVENLSLYKANKDCKEIWLAMGDDEPDHCVRASVAWHHNNCEKFEQEVPYRTTPLGGSDEETKECLARIEDEVGRWKNRSDLHATEESKIKCLWRIESILRNWRRYDNATKR